MIEEQALCRIHRVGQQRNVTTVRYLMRDSFEEVRAYETVDFEKSHPIAPQLIMIAMLIS